jgi:hypothetical protein
LPEAVARIEVKEINGHATDALDYVAHRQGFNVIAIGGDKLSRGLTLEGLSVSYFLRASQMYDTLMQMGRWFGYRPGYLDLCRLFTTEDLRRWYRHIALAELELRREFDRMKLAGLTPRRYGLRVREHPDGLLVTAMNKMSHAQTQRLSYAGQLVQTAHFATGEKVIRANKDIVDRFLCEVGGIGAATNAKLAWLWKNIRPELLLETLLNDFNISEEGWRFQKQELMEFIRRQAGAGELKHWTIALINTSNARRSIMMAGCETGVATRSAELWNGGCYAMRNSNIQSPSHQALDLQEIPCNEANISALLAKRAVKDGGPLFNPDEELRLRQCCNEKTTLAVAAERLTSLRKSSNGEEEKSTRINGQIARHLRPKTHGLLLIYPIVPLLDDDIDHWKKRDPFMGLAFCFPSSDTARSVEYKVNKVWQTMFRDEDYED